METHCFTVYANEGITVDNVKQALIESEMIIQSVCKYDFQTDMTGMTVVDALGEEIAYDHPVYVLEETYDYDGIHYKLVDASTLVGDEFVDRSKSIEQAFNCWVRY